MPTPLPSSPDAAKSLFAHPWTQITELPAAKAAIFQEELLALLKRQPGDAAYSVAPNIPVKKRQNATTALSIPQFDEVLALYDLTMFGSARYSIVYCKNAVYWQDEVLGFRTAGPYRVDYCQMFNLTIGYGEVYVGSEPLKCPESGRLGSVMQDIQAILAGTFGRGLETRGYDGLVFGQRILPSTRVMFCVAHEEVVAGQEIYVVGNTLALGCWNPARAVRLRFDSRRHWTAAIRLATGTRVEYKYICIDTSGQIEWEGGANRVFTPCESERRRKDAWQP